MNIDNLSEKVKSGMDKIFSSSKKAFKKTESTVRKLSDTSVLKVEIKQYESKKKDCIQNLGLLAFNKFEKDENASLSASEAKVKSILESIKEIEKQIKTREQKLEEIANSEEETQDEEADEETQDEETQDEEVLD